MNSDFDDSDSADLPPPPPEFADDIAPPLPPGGSTFRPVSTSGDAHSGLIEDRKFLDEYFCNLTRSEALEALEAVQMDGAYIVRPGSGSPYCISFVHGGETKHVKIQKNNYGQFFLGDTKIELFFDSMSQLMDYLTKNVIQGINGVVFRLIINAKPYSQSIKANRKTSVSSTGNPSVWPQPAPEVVNGVGGRPNMTRRDSSSISPSSGGGGGGGDFVGSTLPGRPVSRGSFSVAPPVTQQPEVPRIRPLAQQRYYIEMRRDEAEAHLMNTRIEGQFLVRPSKASAYCLSVFHRGRVVHLKIVCVGNRFVLEQLMNDGQTFTNVPDLIDSLALSHRTLTLMNGDSIVLRTMD